MPANELRRKRTVNERPPGVDNASAWGVDARNFARDRLVCLPHTYHVDGGDLPAARSELNRDAISQLAHYWPLRSPRRTVDRSR